MTDDVCDPFEKPNSLFAFVRAGEPPEPGRRRLRSAVLRVVASAAFACAAASAHLAACPVCFQVDDGPVPAGVRAAVVVLVAVTAAVVAPAGLFFARLIRRDRARGRSDRT